MDSYNIADAKAQFSELVARAEAGEEIEIKRRGAVVARLGPIDAPKKKIDFDALRRVREQQRARLAAEGKEPWSGPMSFVEWARRNEEI